MSKTSVRNRNSSFRLHVEELERRDAPAAYMGSMFDLNNQVGDSVNQYLMAWTTPSTDPMSVSLTNAPAGISIDNTAHITGTIASGADVNSPYSVTATATDTVDNGTASVTFNCYVTAGAPVTVSLMNPGSQTGSDNASVNLGLMGTDSAGHALTYSATGLPAGLSVSNSMGTGWITGTIGSNDDAAGPYSVTVTATDSLANVSASQTFTWTVTAGAPATVWLMNPGSQTNFDNASVNLGLMATDSAGNALTYSATGLPAGLSVTNSMGTGWITGTIGSYDDASGPYSVTVKATDSVANVSASQSFNWTVSWINHAPSFAASDPPAVDETADPVSIANWATFNPGAPNESTQTATYTVTNVSNPDLFDDLPAVAADGTLTYTVAPFINGTFTFDVEVQDNGGTANGGADTSAVSTFTITVNPMVYFASSEFSADQGATATITVFSDGTSSQDITINYATSDGTAESGSDYTSATGTVTIPAGQSSATFTISILTDSDADDGEGFSVALSNPSHAGLGSPSTAHFTIFVAQGADAITDLNGLSDAIDSRLTTGVQTDTGTTIYSIDLVIADEITYVDTNLSDSGYIDRMQRDRALGTGASATDYRNAASDLQTVAVRQANALANQIMVKAADAAGQVQGEQYRILGVSADLDRLEAKMNYIAGLITQERNVLAGLPDSNPYRRNIALLNATVSQMPDIATWRAGDYADSIDYAVPDGAAGDSIRDLNDNYSTMGARYNDVLFYHVLNVANDFAMTVTAIAISVETPGAESAYNDLIAAFLGNANSINEIVQGPYLDPDASTLALALDAMDDSDGDKYAVKGIREYLRTFDVMLDQEMDMINAQKALLATVYAPGVTPAYLVENLDTIINQVGDFVDYGPLAQAHWSIYFV